MQALKSEQKFPSELRDAFAAHSNNIPNADALKGKVLYFSVKPFFNDPDMFLVQLKLQESWNELLTLIIRAPVVLGATVKFDPAPRDAWQRHTQEALARV